MNSFDDMSEQLTGMNIQENAMSENEVSPESQASHKNKFNPDWTNPKSELFKPWAASADDSDHVYDSFCDKVYHIGSLFTARKTTLLDPKGIKKKRNSTILLTQSISRRLY